MFYLTVHRTRSPLRRCTLCLSSKDKSIVCRQYMHMHMCIQRLLGKFPIAWKHFKRQIDLNSKGVSNMHTGLNNQNITVVKHSTKTCRLINILKEGYILFSSAKISSGSVIFVESQALCRDSSIYRLKLLTSPEGNLPIPTPNPTFFYANKGCNSGDLTYECGISVHPYFHVLSAFENQNN